MNTDNKKPPDANNPSIKINKTHENFILKFTYYLVF